MNKELYLTKLKKMLPEYESQEIINDFEEHFKVGLEEGKTEEQIIESLGNPIDIAKEYGYVDTDKSTLPVSNRVIALIGLIFFDLLFGIAIIGSLIAVWASLWVTVLSLVVAGIAMLVGMFLAPIPWYILLFGGISVLALSVVLGIGMIYVTKYAFKGLVWYGKLHGKIAAGE